MCNIIENILTIVDDKHDKIMLVMCGYGLDMDWIWIWIGYGFITRVVILYSNDNIIRKRLT